MHIVTHLEVRPLHPPFSPIFFIFKQFSAKIMLNNRLVSVTGVGAPIWENLEPALVRR